MGEDFPLSFNRRSLILCAPAMKGILMSNSKKLAIAGLFITLAFLASSQANEEPATAEHKAEHKTEHHGEHKPDFFPTKQANKEVTARPEKVTLLEPKALSQVSGNQVTLKWKEAAQADSYRVQVATDPNFKWLVTNEDFYKATSYELKGLESGKHYFWRVYAFKSENDPGYLSSYSNLSSFEVK